MRRARERIGSWSVHWGEGAPRALLGPALEALAAGATPAGAEMLKRDAARSVLRLPAASGPGVFVKCYPPRSGRPLRAPARREFANLVRLAGRGLPAVEALAWARLPGGLELLATRELPGAEPLSERLARAESCERQTLLAGLAELVRRLHDAGFWHRDLHTANLLVTGGAGSALVLVDVQRLRALPVALPRTLRSRELGFLYHDLGRAVGAERERVLVGYCGGAPAPRFRAAVERAAARRGERRVRRRMRHCVTNSRGFRVERHGSLRIYRRADAPLEAIRAALEGHRRILAARERTREGVAGDGDRTLTRVDGIRAGPPPGPAASPFARGQGAAEPGAPALGAVAVAEFREGGLRRRGLRAWRHAHALLLGGRQVPAPIALVEERRRGRLRASWYLARSEDAEPAGSGTGAETR